MQNVYVEVKVAHSGAYMSENGRKEQLMAVIRDAAKVDPTARMSVAAVDGSGSVAATTPLASSLAGARLAAPQQQPATLTLGAVVFNDEHGEAEREVAAVRAPGTLERVSSAAKAFGVAVLEIGARAMGGGGGRRRRSLLVAA
jgi:hypothetical protein